MSTRLAAFAILALPVLAVATPAPIVARGGGESSSSCDTGPIQCCQSVQSAKSVSDSGLLGLLGINLSDLNVPVGLTCSPISVVGVGSGSTCDASPVCCEDNSYGSLISIGCIPITL